MISKKEIMNENVDNLIQWRNTASKRVSKNTDQIKELEKSIKKVRKDVIKDIKWIKFINRTLSKRVFP